MKTLVHEVPLLDHRIAISAEEMAKLWETGRPTEDALAILESQGYIRSKRSLDGKWHLKFDPLDRRETDTYGLSAQDLCDIHDKELEHLKKTGTGLHVISYGRVALNEERFIKTIGPWIDDIEDLDPDTYGSDIGPIVKQYHQDWLRDQVAKPGTRPYLASDITGQFSVSAAVEAAFLHDVDAYLDTQVPLIYR